MFGSCIDLALFDDEDLLYAAVTLRLPWLGLDTLNVSLRLPKPWVAWRYRKIFRLWLLHWEVSRGRWYLCLLGLGLFYYSGRRFDDHV